MPNRSLGLLTRDQVVDRARSAIGHGTKYELGAGGRDPFAPLPSGAGRTCDCSGFAAWAVGVDRYLVNVPGVDPYLWFETTNLYNDAKREDWPNVAEVAWREALPGDLLVWPDRRVIHQQGHVGVVVAVTDGGPSLVLHCSAGNYRDSGDAIRETDCRMFVRHEALVARVAWVGVVV